MVLLSRALIRPTTFVQAVIFCLGLRVNTCVYAEDRLFACAGCELSGDQPALLLRDFCLVADILAVSVPVSDHDVRFPCALARMQERPACVCVVWFSTHTGDSFL